jgi:microcystin-dependent protein
MQVSVFTLFTWVAASASYAQTLQPAGNGQAFGHSQPGLVMHHVIATTGSYPSPTIASPDGIGTVHLHAGNEPAYGEPSLQGQLVVKSSFENLFNLVGTTYGGDGVTNFALPDLGGRFAVSTGTPDWGDSPLLPGQVFGNPLSQLTLASLPEHRHTLGDGSMLTTYAGQGQPLSKLSPSMPLTYMIAVQGYFPSVIAFPMIGMVRLFAGNFAPAGWLPADGRLLDVDEYETLFQVIGTTYGGDGTTNFALPDLRGRVAVGAGQGAGLNLLPGQYTGAPEVSLGISKLPQHVHSLLDGSDSTNPAGGSEEYSNLQPSLGIKYLIALTGLYPDYENIAFDPQTPALGEVIAFAGINVPNGTAECAGQLLPIVQNLALFSLLGTAYGGDGIVSFALPNLRGRVPIGVGNGYTVGQVVGSATNALTTSTMASHTHEITPVIFDDGFE